jgi:hypothetical protein
MSTFCTKCKINWNALDSYEDTGEEVTLYCPECQTDHHLVEGKEGYTYMRHPFTNEVYCVQTGEVLWKEVNNGLNVSKHKGAYTETKAEHDRRVDKALDAYFTGGEKAYFDSLKGSKEMFMEQREIEQLEDQTEELNG